MEHTNEFLMGIFSAYRGCEVAVHNVDYGYKVIGVISLPDNDDRVYMSSTHPNLKTERSEHISECKPILTTLSEITDEDAVDVAKIFKYQVNEQDKLKFLGLELVDSLVKYELDGFMLRDILAITDYLRSKHYDLGYLHIPSLIEAGLAVKSTK